LNTRLKNKTACDFLFFKRYYPIAQGLLLCLYDQIALFDEVNGKSFLFALEGALRKEALEHLHFDKTISATGLIATNGLTGYPGEVVRARSPVSPFPDPQEKVHCFCSSGGVGDAPPMGPTPVIAALPTLRAIGAK
jgi:hypothetical protein